MASSARVPGPVGTDCNPGRIDTGTLARAESRSPGVTCPVLNEGPGADATVPSKELSGPDWVAKFPGSNSLTDLYPKFQTKVKAFIDAIKAAGGKVVVNATYRPRERAYLMHYSSMIARGEIAAKKVPEMAGVAIEWVHDSDEASVKAAKAMAKAYHIVYPPALISRHTERGAIDMTVTDIVGKKMIGADKKEVEITTNEDLFAVGKGYGVIKLPEDEPHWSDNGH